MANIIITGGASGLGKAITRKLAGNPDHKVLFTFFKGEKPAGDLMKEFSNCIGILCNFQDLKSIDSFIPEMEKFRPDVLINNAIPSLEKKHFHKYKPESFQSGFLHNILPVLKLTQQAITHFRKQKSGKIITILSSALINKPPIGWSQYVAEKNYLLSMSKSWATENSGFNITSNCISPGFMQTDLTSDTDERVIEEMIKSHPLKQLLHPGDVADSVEFLVHSTKHINGTNLIINAGSDVI